MIVVATDIAFRCYKLNPHFKDKAAKKTKGIVMIDNVDMFLHASCQQTIVESLEKAFPEIQFIISTHSPQVISTIRSECICIINKGEIYSAPKGSKGGESSRILKRIFGVDARPKSDNNTKLLLSYENLVYANQWDSKEAKDKRRQLDEIFGDEEPKLTELDLHIENSAWNLGIKDSVDA